jgi:hypothetical protein
MTEQTQKMVESHDLVGVRGLSAHVGSIETQLGRGHGVSARSKWRRGRGRRGGGGRWCMGLAVPRLARSVRGLASPSDEPLGLSPKVMNSVYIY